VGAGDPRDLLTAMLAMRDADGAALDDRSIRFEISGMFIGGKETTATALSWLLALLPRMPAVERRLVDEIDEVLAGRPPTADDLPRLRHVEATLQETMRCHPPVWVLFPRLATEDVILGGHAVARGTKVWISPYVTHHHPDVWPDPDAFAPERFLGDAAERRHPYAWLPFGGGPRLCIGSRFAMIEMQLAVVRLLQRWRVEAASGPPTPRVVFNTRAPARVPIYLVPRD
jgi:cytochrome P450